MRLEYLQCLVEIEKQRSISSAARVLYMGQTTLSSVVKSVEDELGFAVFQRAPRGVNTTPAGSKLIEASREIMALYEQILSLKEDPTPMKEPVKMMISTSAVSGLGLMLNEAFVKAEPTATLVFLEVPQQDIGAQMVQNTASIGLAHFAIERRNKFAPIAAKYEIEVELLAKDHFYVLVNKGHRLAGQKSVVLEDLYNERLAMGTNFTNAPSGMCLSPLYRNNTRFTAFPNIEMIKKAVLEQAMASVLTGCAIYYAETQDLSCYDVIPIAQLHGGNQIDFCLLHQNSKSLHRAEKSLLNCIRKLIAQMPLPSFPEDIV